MHTRSIAVCLGCFVLAVTLTPHWSGAQDSQAQSPTVIPAADVKWADLDPEGAPGVKIAPLWGDPQKGRFGAFLMLPAGFEAPLHTHTHEMQAVIVSGTYIQAPEGKAEFRIGPGSYFLQPGGDYRHTTRCDKASDCVLFFQSEGAFDLHPVTPGTPPTD
jgi:anti-sigma factor ChrR (cupin superfamily)